MKLNEIVSTTKPIILVFGRICSGKGTFCESYIKEGYHHITTSDVVKKLSGATTRDKLQDTKDFDTAIGKEIVKIIKQHDRIIIDGIRQTKIVDEVVKAYGNEVEMIWLEVPEKIRKKRFRDRGDAKDVQTFDDAEIGDTNLGLDAVEAKFKSQSKVVNYY